MSAAGLHTLDPLPAHVAAMAAELRAGGSPFGDPPAVESAIIELEGWTDLATRAVLGELGGGALDAGVPARLDDAAREVAAMVDRKAALGLNPDWRPRMLTLLRLLKDLRRIHTTFAQRPGLSMSRGAGVGPAGDRGRAPRRELPAFGAVVDRLGRPALQDARIDEAPVLLSWLVRLTGIRVGGPSLAAASGVVLERRQEGGVARTYLLASSHLAAPVVRMPTSAGEQWFTGTQRARPAADAFVAELSALPGFASTDFSRSRIVRQLERLQLSVIEVEIALGDQLPEVVAPLPFGWPAGRGAVLGIMGHPQAVVQIAAARPVMLGGVLRVVGVGVAAGGRRSSAGLPRT